MCTYKLAECGVVDVDVAQNMLRILYIIYGYGGKDKKIPLFMLGVLGVPGHFNV